MLAEGQERSDAGGPGGTPPGHSGSDHRNKKCWRKASIFCGDGRSRTAVQTKSQIAFYTLILSLVVGPKLPKGRPPRAYPLKS